MPLSENPKDVGKNIQEMISSGHSRDQAIAASLKATGKSKNMAKKADRDDFPSTWGGGVKEGAKLGLAGAVGLLAGKGLVSLFEEPSSPGGTNTNAPELQKKKFEEDDDFISMDRVPVFDAHHGSEEDLQIDFDEEMLKRIIDRCNERINETGDYPVITEGHNEEDKEAPVLGFADNFSMGEIGSDKRKCIYCDLHIRKEHYDKAKALPRRSIELWTDDLTTNSVSLEKKKLRSPIDTISLLGATRPARDLGVRFEKKSSGKVIYNYQSKELNMDQNQLTEILQAVMALPAMKFIEKLMQQQQQEEAPQEFEEEEKADKPMEDKPPVEPKEAKFEEVDDSQDEDEVGKEKLKMRFDQSKRKYAKLDSEYKTLFAKVEQLERRERRADRKAQFMQLEAEGFVFDLADELSLVEDYEPAKFQKHVSIIKKNYKKAPIGVHVSQRPTPEAGGTNSPVAKTPHEVLLEASKRAEGIYTRGK